MSEQHGTGILRRIAFAAMTFAVICGCMVAPSSHGAETPVPEEYIFRVLMPPQWTIADAIFAYQFRGAYYLPVVELAEAYEFYVDAETDRAYVTGFAGREENSFAIDGEQGEYTVKGRTQPLPDGAVLSRDLVDDGDIYVRIDILNEMWPVEMRVDLSSITIYAEAEEELSFVRRKEREGRKAAFDARQERKSEVPDNLPFRENAYQWFGKPVLDLQSTYTYSNRTKEFTAANNVSGTQQLGKFVADYSAAYGFADGSLVKPDAVRARFLRQAPGGEDLFVPTLKRVELGDVSAGQRNLVGNSIGGRGAILSNTPSSKTREFDRITVEGTGPPGWELELYNNNELLRFGKIAADGEYRFEDVILNYGNNRIRVIMYGPQGQLREVVEEHQVAGSLLSPGEFRYRVAAVDTDRPFIPLAKVVEDHDHVVTSNAELSYGYNDWLTVFGSYSSVPFQDAAQRYLTAGAGLSTPVGIGEVEGYRQVDGGSAIDMRFITEMLGVRLNLRGALFNGFESPDAGTGDTAKTYEAEVQANTTIPLPFVPISFRLNALQRELVDGTRTLEAGTSQSFTGGGMRFSHGTNTRFLDRDLVSSTGDFNVNWNSGAWQTRGSLSYLLYPDAMLNVGSTEVRYTTRNDFQAAFNFQHNFQESLSTIGGQAGYDFGDMLATVDAQYVQERGWQFVMRASTSLSPYYPGGAYKLSSNSRRGYAPALGHVFLDRDGDGVYGDGDEPLDDVRLQINGWRSQERTDKDGYVVAALRADEPAAIRIDESTLADPYYRPGVPGFSTIGLKGSMPGFSFPVVETGAIDGVVSRDPGGRPVSGMVLQLVKDDGTVAMTTQSAFDGYYSFEFVLPGTYTVRADPSYQVNVPTETVTVSSDELFAFGVDLFLLEPAAEESAADLADGDSGGIAQDYHSPAVRGTEQPAPVSPHDEGSSLVSGETSDEDDASIAESPKDGGRSSVPADLSGGGVSSVVKDFRIGAHPDKMRAVLDLSEDAAYSVEAGGEGYIVLIDLPGASWDAPAGAAYDGNGVLAGYETEELPGGGTRLILRARERMSVDDHKALPAADGKGPRIYIDLVKRGD